MTDLCCGGSISVHDICLSRNRVRKAIEKIFGEYPEGAYYYKKDLLEELGLNNE